MEQLAKEDICLAFSGGVDSSLLLKTAADAAAIREERCTPLRLTAACILLRPGDCQARGRGAGRNP